MYGLVNKALQRLVQTEHGHGAWLCIVERAGLEEPSFVGLEAYDDAITYDLVRAASEELEIEPAALLEAFGEHWMRYLATEGYGPLIDLTADSFEGFLTNLDDLHARIALVYHELAPPSFSLVDSRPGAWTLRYESDRSGLAPMVVGLLRVLAERFGREVDIRYEEHTAREDGADLLFHIEDRAAGAGEAA